MSAENLFGKIADLRVKNAPLGKGALYLLGLFPGKFVTGLVRNLVAKYAPVDKKISMSKWAAVLGPVAGILLAMGWETRFIKRLFGDTLAEALAVGTVAGSIDAAYAPAKMETRGVDISDVVVDKILGKVAPVGALPAPTATSSPEYSFPELGTSGLGAFPGEETGTFGEEKTFGTPEELGDPVQDIEDKLKELI